MKKQLIRIVSAIFPSLITSFAYKQLTNPQVHKLRENELKTLDRADKESIAFKGFDIVRDLPVLDSNQKFELSYEKYVRRQERKG